jgi:protein farnesyltransferase/geranylgeranyltransferase type-1 subunit alpha
MNYFRAVLRSGEKSARVMLLLNDVAEVNASNYTVWYGSTCARVGSQGKRTYRRQVIRALKWDLKQELSWIGGEGLEHPKNYQIWSALSSFWLL